MPNKKFEQFLDKCYTKLEDKQRKLFEIYDIGTICFSHIIKGFFLSCYVGYSIDYSETNKGYITEALRKGIDIMFDEYKLHRMEATVMPKNISSLKVLEKLNFKNEGLSEKYQRINGKWEDHLHMVLLNSKVE